jgi:Fe-S-cluster containining protein
MLPQSDRDRPAGPESPAFRGSPQKTLPQKPKPEESLEGPLFDFEDPRVKAAGEALREAALALEDSLPAPARDGSDCREAYHAAREALEERLPAFHRRYEDYVRAVVSTGNENVTCSRGCGHCCSHYVSSVEPFELVRLHGLARRSPAYPARLVAFHRRVSLYKSLLGGRLDEEADDRALFRYFLRDLPCPFLTEAGACGIYESRPMSCRMFFSMSHPSLCRGKAAASPGNRNFIVELPDDIEAAVMRASERLAAFELPDTLFEGLLEANARFGPFDAEGEDPGSRPG